MLYDEYLKKTKQYFVSIYLTIRSIIYKDIARDEHMLDFC